MEHVLGAVASSGPEPETLDRGLGVLAALLGVDATRVRFFALNGAATVVSVATAFTGDSSPLCALAGELW